jgi:hypothetical protein
MKSEIAKLVDRELAKERYNVLRIVGGLLLLMALMFFFFHLGEARMGKDALGVMAGVLCSAGVVLLVVGWYKLRGLR